MRRILGVLIALLAATPLVLIVGFWITSIGMAIYRPFELSQRQAERQVEARGMTADRERKYGPIRLLVPEGFRRIASSQAWSDRDAIHWTGRGVLITLRLGQQRPSV